MERATQYDVHLRDPYEKIKILNAVMPLLPCAHIRKSYVEKSLRSANPAARDVHGTPHWNLSFNFFPPPKTGSREEAGRRKRRLGRIDSFSRGEHTEPFPGWQQAGGAAHAGEQGEGAGSHLPQPLPAPRRRAQWSPARARPFIRCCRSSLRSSEHRKFEAPAAENE